MPCKQARNFLPLAVSVVFLLVGGNQDAHAARFHFTGSAGTFAPSTELELLDGIPIDLSIPNTLPTPADGSRSATASGFGVTAGTANLAFNLGGRLARIDTGATGNSDAQVSE